MKPTADRAVAQVPAGLTERREQLLLRSTQLRQQLGQRARVLQPALRLNDRLGEGMQVLRQHPSLGWAAAATLLGLTVARPRLVFGLGLRAWSGWRLFRRAQPLAFALWRQLLR